MSHPIPYVLTNTAATDGSGPGAVWRLTETERGLDANLIALPAGDGIAVHTGPDLDVLIHVVAGSGQLETADGPVELAPGDLLWLPRGTVRGFTPGPSGLRYLTVHQHREITGLHPTFETATR